MVSLVLEQARGTVVTEIPAWSVDTVNILVSRVLLVPPVSVSSVDLVMSVGSVVTVVAVVSVESVVSSYLGRL